LSPSPVGPSPSLTRLAEFLFPYLSPVPPFLAGASILLLFHSRTSQKSKYEFVSPLSRNLAFSSFQYFAFFCPPAPFPSPFFDNSPPGQTFCIFAILFSFPCEGHWSFQFFFCTRPHMIVVSPTRRFFFSAHYLRASGFSQ